MTRYKLNNDRVIETKTNNVVCSGPISHNVFKRLNSGAGFLGFTPDFFCRSISQ